LMRKLEGLVQRPARWGKIDGLQGSRQIIAQPPGVDSAWEIFFRNLVSPAAHEEFITKGCQTVMARPSPYSPASVPARQVLSFRPDIRPGRTVLGFLGPRCPSQMTPSKNVSVLGSALCKNDGRNFPPRQGLTESC
jgi:hypothetical protein